MRWLSALPRHSSATRSDGGFGLRPPPTRFTNRRRIACPSGPPAGIRLRSRASPSGCAPQRATHCCGVVSSVATRPPARACCSASSSPPGAGPPPQSPLLPAIARKASDGGTPTPSCSACGGPAAQTRPPPPPFRRCRRTPPLAATARSAPTLLRGSAVAIVGFAAPPRKTPSERGRRHSRSWRRRHHRSPRRPAAGTAAPTPAADRQPFAVDSLPPHFAAPRRRYAPSRRLL